MHISFPRPEAQPVTTHTRTMVVWLVSNGGRSQVHRVVLCTVDLAREGIGVIFADEGLRNSCPGNERAAASYWSRAYIQL